MSCEAWGLVGFDPVTVLRDPFERLFSAYRFSRMTIKLGQEGDEAMQLAARTCFGEWAFSPFGQVQQHSHLNILGLNADDSRLDGMLVGTVDQPAEFLGFVFRRWGTPWPAMPRARKMAA